jgi:integrase/recombinase XerD
VSVRINNTVTSVFADLPSAESRRAYEGAWGRYAAWLRKEKVDVVKVKPRHIVAYLTRLREEGKAKATIGHALSVIREVYAALVRDEILESNPAREVKKPRMTAEPRTPLLTEEEVQRLFDVPAKSWKERRDLLCLQLLFGTGRRRAEVARMRVEDFQNGVVVGKVKGDKTLATAAPGWLLAAIQEWLDYAGIKEGALLPRAMDNRRPVSGDIVYKVVKTAATRAGLPLERVTPHALRRSKITIEGERGVSLRQRQLAVGHSSQATTERYDWARDATKSSPAEALRDLADRRLSALVGRVEKQDWDLRMLQRVVTSSDSWTGSRGWPQDDQLFVDMLRAGVIRVSFDEIDWKLIEEKWAQEFRVKSASGPGGSSHHELKWLACCWLYKRGEISPQCEVPIIHGTCDVWSPQLQIAVECGDVEAIRIADGLAFGYREFVVIPFEPQQKTNTVVIFTANDEKLIEFAAAGAFERSLIEVVEQRLGRKISATTLRYDRGARGAGVTGAVAKFRQEKK